MKTDKTKCLLCEKELEYEIWDGSDPETINPLYGGVWFRGYGQYGSTVYDPMNHEWLQIAICDACLLKRAKEIVRISHITKKEQNNHKEETFQNFLDSRSEFRE